MTQEQKTFEYMELKAMCMLVAAECILYTIEKKFKNEVEGRKWIEAQVEETVKMRWDQKDKISL